MRKVSERVPINGYRLVLTCAVPVERMRPVSERDVEIRESHTPGGRTTWCAMRWLEQWGGLGEDRRWEEREKREARERVGGRCGQGQTRERATWIRQVMIFAQADIPGCPHTGPAKECVQRLVHACWYECLRKTHVFGTNVENGSPPVARIPMHHGSLLSRVPTLPTLPVRQITFL